MAACALPLCTLCLPRLFVSLPIRLSIIFHNRPTIHATCYITLLFIPLLFRHIHQVVFQQRLASNSEIPPDYLEMSTPRPDSPPRGGWMPSGSPPPASTALGSSSLSSAPLSVSQLVDDSTASQLADDTPPAPSTLPRTNTPHHEASLSLPTAVDHITDSLSPVVGPRSSSVNEISNTPTMAELYESSPPRSLPPPSDEPKDVTGPPPLAGNSQHASISGHAPASSSHRPKRSRPPPPADQRLRQVRVERRENRPLGAGEPA